MHSVYYFLKGKVELKVAQGKGNGCATNWPNQAKWHCKKGLLCEMLAWV